MNVSLRKPHISGRIYSVFAVQFKGELKDTKGVIRIRKSKKHRQHNGQAKKYKRTNNYLQNMCIKLKIELHEAH
jgi:branched-subunit amino acid aminotransferase/4-amino-4-deoxychorismate lyase